MNIQCPRCGEDIVLTPEMLCEEFVCPYCGLLGIIEIKWRETKEE